MIILIIILIAMLTYVLCKAASMDDQAREYNERLWEYEDKDFFEHKKPK